MNQIAAVAVETSTFFALEEHVEANSGAGGTRVGGHTQEAAFVPPFEIEEVELGIVDRRDGTCGGFRYDKIK